MNVKVWMKVRNTDSGAGTGTTMTPYSERRTLVTIVEEKLQVKR